MTSALLCPAVVFSGKPEASPVLMAVMFVAVVVAVMVGVKPADRGDSAA